MKQVLAAGVVVFATASVTLGQTPQPFPGAGLPSQSRQSPPPTGTVPAQPPSTSVQSAAPADPDAPSAEAVGFPVYPNARFLGSYDAGKGQRYYLFGTVTSYGELVKYYQTVLKDRGARIYEEPATHTFAQRFREETMAFPPGVTVKDWTSGGSAGYPNPTLGEEPARFPSVIMIVPPPPPGPEDER